MPGRIKFYGFLLVFFVIVVLAIYFVFLNQNFSFNAPIVGEVSLPEIKNKLTNSNEECYKYVGEVKDAWCDSQKNLHFYFQGDERLKEGWVVMEKHEECKPCDYISK